MVSGWWKDEYRTRVGAVIVGGGSLRRCRDLVSSLGAKGVTGQASGSIENFWTDHRQSYREIWEWGRIAQPVASQDMGELVLYYSFLGSKRDGVGAKTRR